MAFDPRQHVVPGQPLRIAAEQINWLNQQMRRPRPTTASTGEDFAAPYTWVYARNSTGGAVSRWDALEITGVDITPTAADSDAATKQFHSMPVLTAGEIDGSADKWCVAIEPIANGEIGRVAVDGAVQVRKADVDKLGGVVVLWENATWAIVRPGGGGGSPLLTGTFDGDWAAAATKTVEVDGTEYTVFNGVVGVTAPAGGKVTFTAPAMDEGVYPADYLVVAFDLTLLAGYHASQQRVLVLTDGLLNWIATKECPVE